MPLLSDKKTKKQCIPNNTMLDQYLEFSTNTVFKSHCAMPCTSMEVNYPTSFKDSRGSSSEGYVFFYLPNIIKVQSSQWSYPLISLLAEVGGYMGLLLGMSLLDLNKLLNWIYSIYQQRTK